MTLRRLIPAFAALAASALLFAGCGASEVAPPPSAAGDVPASASLAPTDATAFVTISTDTASRAWADAGRLVDLVPGAREALDGAVDRMLRETGLSWAKDVEPALGPELLVVVTKENRPLVLMQPEDRSVIEKLASEPADGVLGEVNGWTVAAEKQADIDAYRTALEAGTLIGAEGFRAAMEALPATAIARAYVSGANLMRSVRQLTVATIGDQKLSLESMSLAVVPERAGVLLTATVTTPGGGDGTSYEPSLLRRVPADAVAALSFGGTAKSADDLRLGDVAKRVEEVTGVSLDRLVGAFSGEGILYLRAGTTIPEITLVLAPPDVDAAFEDVGTIVGELAEGMEAEVETVEQDGVTVHRVDQGDVNVSYARVDDAVVLTTGASGIRLFREDGDKLADAEGFRRAADKVGLADRTSGFLYVDVDGLVPLVEGVADTADQTLPDEARKAMEAFDSVMLVATSGEGGTTTMSGFVATREP